MSPWRGLGQSEARPDPWQYTAHFPTSKSLCEVNPEKCHHDLHHGVLVEDEILGDEDGPHKNAVYWGMWTPSPLPSQE